MIWQKQLLPRWIGVLRQVLAVHVACLFLETLREIPKFNELQCGQWRPPMMSGNSEVAPGDRV